MRNRDRLLIFSDFERDAVTGATHYVADCIYNEADVRFMSNMIGHHAQAIYMSRMAPTHGAGPAVRTLADRIINAQQDEIGIMQTWLRDRGKAAPDPAHSAGMPGMEHMHHAGSSAFKNVPITETVREF